jgi:hypothetical protein
VADSARAQSYGDHDQVLTIGAAQFGSEDGPGGSIDTDGYLTSGASGGYFQAPLALPEGARIEQLCLYAKDSDPFGSVQVILIASKLVPGGETPGAMGFLASLARSTSDVGYGYYCTDAIDLTLRSTLDVDSDGVLDNVAYYVAANVPSPSEGALGLGGVRLTWKREVSPAPATPTFGDVPTTDGAYAHIEALVSSGITSGCGGGNYCPNAKLTRRQMAVFLSKALGLHWSN